jgi:hypothetical protein
MPTVFRHVVNAGIGTTPIDVLQIPTGVRATVIGCNIANVTEADTVNVDVYVVDASSTQAAYAKGIAIPPQTSVKVVTNGEKLILPETAGLRVVSNVDSSIDTTVSYVEIS